MSGLRHVTLPRLRLRLTTRERVHPVARWLDEVFFPWVVLFMTARPHIMFLLASLLVIENPTMAPVVMLMLGNYTNVVSAASSAIVLRQQTTHHEDQSGDLAAIRADLALLKAHLGLPADTAEGATASRIDTTEPPEGAG